MSDNIFLIAAPDPVDDNSEKTGSYDCSNCAQPVREEGGGSQEDQEDGRKVDQLAHQEPGHGDDPQAISS